MQKRRIVDCQCCGKRRKHYGNNLCSACHSRWLDHGKPAVCPPPAKECRTFTLEDRRLAREALTAARLSRIEDYVWLTREQRLSRDGAAARMGISIRTAERYEAAIKHGEIAA
jgi:hypothetical protein